MSQSLLRIRNLQITFQTEAGTLTAVRGIDLDLSAHQHLAIVGESGAGKSQIAHAIMGLLPPNGNSSGSIRFGTQELLNQPLKTLNQIRGQQISMVFQDPMSSLNPYLTIGRQLTEVLQVHRKMPARQARLATIKMLARVQLPTPEQLLTRYPHELSGGMRQRVMIAMALLCQPKILIADEPTTALDVTLQAGIIALLRALTDTRILMITHDLPLVAGLCDQIIVMYAGEFIEYGPSEEIFHAPLHPYTQQLLAAIPSLAQPGDTLPAIPGTPPDPSQHLTGCAFHPRCPQAMDLCRSTAPQLSDRSPAGHPVACHRVFQ